MSKGGKSSSSKTKKFEDMDAVDKLLDLYGNEWELETGSYLDVGVDVDVSRPINFSSDADFSTGSQLTYEASLVLSGSANSLGLDARRLTGSGSTEGSARRKLVTALEKRWSAPKHKNSGSSSSSKKDRKDGGGGGSNQGSSSKHGSKHGKTKA